ncbi:MAG TPA: PQQ-binding-like beta-propeller repeat protein [Gemmataceae bacterium]|nr:PQQ-binding-like beta-propeller repeat protein [Gemmataceae bacterium]
MRKSVCLICLLFFGCRGTEPAAPPTTSYTPLLKIRAQRVRKDPDRPSLTLNADRETAPKPGDPLPKDLRTRKSGSDWPTFLGPTGDSISTEKGILTTWPKAGPRIVWQRSVGEGYCMPAISRGRLFLFDRAGDRARLRCCKSENGEPLWTFDYPTDYQDLYGYSGGPRCSPVVDGDRVYIYGVEGMLHCIRVEDGKLIWRVDTLADFDVRQNFFGVGSTPVIEGNLLIAQVGGSANDDRARTARDRPKGNDSGIVAFDKYTGKVRYHVTDETASYASPVLATIDGRRWCFVFARGGLVGLEPATGKVEFHYPWRAPILESVNAGNPVVVGNRVFISETYGPGSALLEVKPGDCKEIWTDKDKGIREKSMRCHWNTPIHVGGYVYGCSGRHTEEAELRCVELATRKVMWRKRGLTRTSLLLVDNHFICLGEDGILRLLKANPDKYEELSSVELREPRADGNPGEPLLAEPCWAAPILSHGLLYVRGRDRLVCLELIPKDHSR